MVTWQKSSNKQSKIHNTARSIITPAEVLADWRALTWLSFISEMIYIWHQPHTFPRSNHFFFSLAGRAVASLTVLGGQEFQFLHFFPQIWIKFSYFSSNLTYFLPHFGSLGGRVAHPGRPWLRQCWQIIKGCNNLHWQQVLGR